MTDSSSKPFNMNVIRHARNFMREGTSSVNRMAGHIMSTSPVNASIICYEAEQNKEYWQLLEPLVREHMEKIRKATWVDATNQDLYIQMDLDPKEIDFHYLDIFRNWYAIPNAHEEASRCVTLFEERIQEFLNLPVEQDLVGRVEELIKSPEFDAEQAIAFALASNDKTFLKIFSLLFNSRYMVDVHPRLAWRILKLHNDSDGFFVTFSG
jgi:hypothetical protein